MISHVHCFMKDCIGKTLYMYTSTLFDNIAILRKLKFFVTLISLATRCLNLIKIRFFDLLPLDRY